MPSAVLSPLVYKNYPEEFVESDIVLFPPSSEHLAFSPIACFLLSLLLLLLLYFPWAPCKKNALEKKIAATFAHKSQAPRKKGKKCSKPFSRKKLFSLAPRGKNQHLSLFNMGRGGLFNTFFFLEQLPPRYWAINPSLPFFRLAKKEEEHWDSAKRGPKKKPFLLLHPEIPPSLDGGGGGGGG